MASSHKTPPSSSGQNTPRGGNSVRPEYPVTPGKPPQAQFEWFSTVLLNSEPHQPRLMASLVQIQPSTIRWHHTAPESIGSTINMSKELATRLQEAGIDLSAPIEVPDESPSPSPDYDDWRDELRDVVDVPIHIVTLD